MLHREWKTLAWVVAASCLCSGTTDGKPGDEHAKGVRDVYVSPINNSSFFGLSPDEARIWGLLTSPVADELNLTPKQVEKLKSIYLGIAERSIPLQARLMSHPSAEGIPVRLQIRAELGTFLIQLDAKMAEALDAGQLERVRQILLQVKDPSVLLTDPWASGQLNLGAHQRDELKRIVAKMWTDEVKLKDRLWAGELKETAEIRRAVQEGREHALKEMIGVLDAEQVATLRQLLGKPYDVERLRWGNPSSLSPVSWWHGTTE